MLLMLPALIAETGLLRFISRHHLPGRRGARLREIPLREATMQRRLVVTHREGGYLAPAAERLITLLEGAPDDDSSSRKGSPTAS